MWSRRLTCRRLGPAEGSFTKAVGIARHRHRPMRRANCSSASDRGTSKGFLLANGKTHSLPSNETPYQEPHDWLDAFELAALSQLNAHSAASSLALLRFLPSYQYLASTVLPWTMTLLDHAVRPPGVPQYVSTHLRGMLVGDSPVRT